MDTTIPIELLLRLINATPEQRAVVVNLRGAGVTLPATCRGAAGMDEDTALGNTRPTARFVFRNAGSLWDIVFDGSETFHLPPILGTKYIGHFLHHANGPVSSFDAERIIQPEKAQVRAKDSVQGLLDAEAVRQYLRQLVDLRGQRAEAAEDGDLATVDRLDEDIEAIEAALKQPGQASDAGERARVNVNKAVSAVLRRLQRGGPTEQAFGRHLEQFLSLGYECCYHQPPGICWE
jgi:hypothetical protein